MTHNRIISHRVAADANDINLGEIDLLLAAATWDRRCLSITELSFEAAVPHIVFLKFANRGTSGRVDRNETTLMKHFTKISRNPVLTVEIDSENLVEAWSRVRKVALDVYETVGRPIRIGVDLNSIPRYIALSLLGFGARTGIVERISALYTAAKSYKSVNTKLAFTEGSWRPRAIPTLGDGASPSARSVLVVSGGFEGEHTLRLVNALEPDRVIVALSSGIDDAHDQHSRRASVGLAQEYIIGDAGIVSLPAADVEASLRALDDTLRGVQSIAEDSVAVSFLLCGTKIGAFVMGLYAIDHAIAQVFYAQPERRLESSAVEIEWHLAVTVAL